MCYFDTFLYLSHTKDEVRKITVITVELVLSCFKVPQIPKYLPIHKVETFTQKYESVLLVTKSHLKCELIHAAMNKIGVGLDLISVFVL